MKWSMIPEVRERQNEEYALSVHQSIVKMKFGISKEQYNEMMKKQGGVCAICKKENDINTMKGRKRKLALDHNHTTGKNRGFLCHYCNVALGYFKDDIKNLKGAIEYLEQYK